MKKENKLVNKIERLLRRANCPRYLHHYGPKKYEFYIHALCLLIKEICKLSFRRVSNLLRMLGFDVPSYSALCKMRKRIPLRMWKDIFRTTVPLNCHIAAVDSTGISRNNPSWHYTKRINSKKPIKGYIKLSTFLDTRRKKLLALRVRAKPRHDIKDFNYLLRQYSNFNKLVGDTAYDAEMIHKKCFDTDIITVIKPRKNVRRGFYRKKQMKFYSEKTYHRRSMIESGFGSLKRKYGSSTLAKTITTQRAEIYCKATLYNLSLILQETFN